MLRYFYIFDLYGELIIVHRTQFYHVTRETEIFQRDEYFRYERMNVDISGPQNAFWKESRIKRMNVLLYMTIQVAESVLTVDE